MHWTAPSPPPSPTTGSLPTLASRRPQHLSCAHRARGGSRGGCQDKLANDVEHNRRHNSTLNKCYDMVSAVAIGQVGKGDKADKLSKWELNEGTVVEIFELEGDEISGGDALMEVKVLPPTTKSFLTGKGKEGWLQAVELRPLDCLWQYRGAHRAVFGLKGRGRQRDGPFNHQTGMAGCKLSGAPTMTRSMSEVPSLPHASGGNGERAPFPASLKVIGYHARRARGKHARMAPSMASRARARLTSTLTTPSGFHGRLTAAIGAVRRPASIDPYVVWPSGS